MAIRIEEMETWIYLRCLERVNHVLPNGGFMVIHHGTK